jgi:hypothetical protein
MARNGPFIDGLPIDSMVIFHGYVKYSNQRVPFIHIFTTNYKMKLPHPRLTIVNGPGSHQSDFLWHLSLCIVGVRQ